MLSLCRGVRPSIICHLWVAFCGLGVVTTCGMCAVTLLCVFTVHTLSKVAPHFQVQPGAVYHFTLHSHLNLTLSAATPPSHFFSLPKKQAPDDDLALQRLMSLTTLHNHAKVVCFALYLICCALQHENAHSPHSRSLPHTHHHSVSHISKQTVSHISKQNKP